MPYFIKDKYPELIDRFNIPLDEYPRRCVNQIEKWGKMRQELVEKHDLTPRALQGIRLPHHGGHGDERAL